MYPYPMMKFFKRVFSSKKASNSKSEVATTDQMICTELGCHPVVPDQPPSTSCRDEDAPEPGIIAWKDTVPFTFPISEGQVIKVYDGDTITIASKLPYPTSPLYRLSVRLNGIDTPEIKGKSEDEKQAAKNARDALANLIYGKQIRLENVQSEKYGRILADVYLGELHLNRWLINNRYAVAYDGGTKVAPTSWLKYKENGDK
jgi:micrococcal nuclease